MNSLPVLTFSKRNANALMQIGEWERAGEGSRQTDAPFAGRTRTAMTSVGSSATRVRSVGKDRGGAIHSPKARGPSNKDIL